MNGDARMQPGAGGQVVAALDASLFTQGVCRHAAWAASRLGVPLACLHVVEDRRARAGAALVDVALDPGTALLDEAELLETSGKLDRDARGQLLLQQAGALATRECEVQVRALLGRGPLAGVLGTMATDAALFVMGRRGEQSEFEKARMGSQVERVVRGIGQPLLVASRGFSGIRRVLVAYDGSDNGNRRMEWVARSPLFTGLDMRVVTVGDDGMRPALDRALGMLADAGMQATGKVVHGDPQEVIGQHAEAVRADLLVMGAYGRSRIHQLLMGSTTSTLLRTSRIPVLLLH